MNSEADEFVHIFRHEPLLGTVVEVRIAVPGDDDDRAAAAESASASVVAEVVRLESIFSTFNPQSELRRWCSGDVAAPSEELAEVLCAALDWQVRSDGAFNPAVASLGRLWAEAAAAGRLPDRSLVEVVVAEIAAPRIRLVDGVPLPAVAGADLNLNAIAKGFIADRAARLGASLDGVRWVSVNAGGDVAHRGDGSLVVGVEHPLRRFDNEPPVATVRIANAGLATSGPHRRGVRIGDQWFGHVLDPRTGRPADHLASITVAASDAVMADVLTTVAGALEPHEAIATVNDLSTSADGPGSLCVFMVDRHGSMHWNQAWEQISL